jgi:hypothetical protein
MMRLCSHAEFEAVVGVMSWAGGRRGLRLAMVACEHLSPDLLRMPGHVTD